MDIRTSTLDVKIVVLSPILKDCNIQLTDGREYKVGYEALTQLFNRIGLTRTWARNQVFGKEDEALTSAPNEIVREMHHRFDVSPKVLLLRIAHGECYAVLSPKYVGIADELLMNTTNESLKEVGMVADGYQIAKYSGRHYIVTNLSHESDGKSVGTDDVSGGLCVVNSYSGKSSIGVMGMTTELSCLNQLPHYTRSIVDRKPHLKSRDNILEWYADAVVRAVGELEDLSSLYERAQSAEYDVGESHLDTLDEIMVSERVKKYILQAIAHRRYNADNTPIGVVRAMTGLATHDARIKPGVKIQLQTQANKMLEAIAV